MVEYYKQFGKLDSLDLKIIKALHKDSTRKVDELAKELNVPQQTLSYRLGRFGKKDLVRFRAVINEAKLGLKSYIVLGTAKIGKEDYSSSIMTCFPLWRYLAIVDGWRHGNYVRYIIPPDKETDLKAFLEELKNRDIILNYEIIPTTTPKYPLLNLNFYSKHEGTPVFDGKKWLADFDSFEEKSVEESVGYIKAKFDIHDLLILRCLEINARMKHRKIAKEMAIVLGEKNCRKFISLVSRRMTNVVKKQGFIGTYRTYIFPNPGPTVLFLIYHLNFANSHGLKKFIGGLSYLPYNTAYQRVLQRDELFVHMAIAVYDYSHIQEVIARLGETGDLKESHLLLGDLTQATWDNVGIYQMYKNGAWNFSYGVAFKMLEKLERNSKAKK
jgi:DNA-binding Lrp family transcriptional regulator